MIPSTISMLKPRLAISLAPNAGVAVVLGVSCSGNANTAAGAIATTAATIQKLFCIRLRMPAGCLIQLLDAFDRTDNIGKANAVAVIDDNDLAVRD